ncbi:MAG: radical SAM protein [Thermodesulfovibrionia bacterium]
MADVDIKYPLRQIYFYLTNGCNLACKHCWIDPVHKTDNLQVIPVELFKKVIEEAIPLGIVGVKLTGGEPLLHPHIDEILCIIKERGLRLTIETNGLLCTSKLVKKIKEACENPFVSVSLDGANAQTHEWIRGVKGSFKSAIDGIRMLVDAGIMPQIIMTLMRSNKEEIEDVIGMAESLGAGSVKFNVMQPEGRARKLHKQGEALDIRELIEIGMRVEGGSITSKRLRLYFHHPLAFRPLGRMFGSDGDGCGTCMIKTIIGVLSDGSYSICGIGETVRELVFGNACNDSLRDVWYNSPILNELREGLPNRLEGVCARCLMRFRCLGACIAQNYSLSRSLWSGFWYCESAFNEGLFPKSRLSNEARYV